MASLSFSMLNQTRADRNRNPAAITIDVARDGGLVLGTDYEQGDPFTVGNHIYYTAKLLGDPLVLTIKVIDTAGWQTHTGGPRWTYMDFINSVWAKLTTDDKVRIIGRMYWHEGGTEMKSLFPV